MKVVRLSKEFLAVGTIVGEGPKEYSGTLQQVEGIGFFGMKERFLLFSWQEWVGKFAPVEPRLTDKENDGLKILTHNLNPPGDFMQCWEFRTEIATIPELEESQPFGLVTKWPETAQWPEGRQKEMA